MIVDTLAEAQQVLDYIRASDLQLGTHLFDGVTKEEAIDAIRSGRAILAVRAPDAAMLIVRENRVIGPFTHVWAGRWVNGSALADIRGVAIDTANALIAAGEGDTPVYWTKSSTLGNFIATRLGTRTYTADGVTYNWYTANEGLAKL